MATILVVDDRPVNREFLTMLLGYAGHRVIEAGDGHAGLEAARREHPSLIISDIVMPTMDGVEFARCLRTDAAIASIPIIFYTASYRLGDAHSVARGCGVDTVLTKPSKPQLILDAVAATLGVNAAPTVKPPTLVGTERVGGQDLNLSLRLSMLIELGLELSAQRDPQRLLDLVCRAGQEMFSAEYAAVGIVDQAAGCLRRFAMRGYVGEGAAWFATLDPCAGILGEVLRDGKPCRLLGLAGNAAASGLPAGHPPIDSLLLAPLTSAMHSYGWLALANRAGGGFGEVDEQIATTIAAKLALAYDNLFLYDMLQSYTARLEADSEAIKRLNAGLAEQVKARQISETRFRLAMEAGTTLAYTLDNELRYTWVHSCRRDICPQAVLGKTDFELFTEDTARSLTAAYRQAIASGAGLRRDVIIRRRPESPGEQFDLVVEPLHEAGQLTGVICAAVDITERKRGEAELLAAKAAAERASEAKSRFLAAASHDLRQPLAALNLYVESMMRCQEVSDSRPALVNMKDCVASLSEMLGDLLDLAKLDAGVTTPSLSDVSLRAILAKLVAVHAPDASAKGLALRCTAAPFVVRTDPVLFGRVIGNFLANAVRYTERGGVLVGCRRRRGKIRVEVWDTGIGIAADKTNEIFEEFRQLANDARDRSRGSGLGLAIAAKTAAVLGLQIEVRSRPGRGSMFAVALPQGLAIAPVAQPEFGCRPLRIAVVEDDPRVVEALLFALSNIGHQVVFAVCGHDLLAKLDGMAPDIVISDYRLAAGETGFDVVASLRKVFGKEVPAIIITGDTDPKLMVRAAANGIVIKHKPIGIKALQERIAELTGSDSVAST